MDKTNDKAGKVLPMYRPLTVKKSHLENGHFVDYYYPTCYDKKRKKRFYYGKHGNIIRFDNREASWAWLKFEAFNRSSKEGK